MAATDATCQGDVRKLARYFETLGASSKESRKPFSSGRSADSGAYFPDDFSSSYIGPRTGGGAFMKSQPIHVVTDSGKIVTYIPADMRSEFGKPVVDGDASTEEGPCVPCDKCSKEHPRFSYCPEPCNICYKVHHPCHCPYFDHLPQGATFDRGFEVYCACSSLFNEDKWACTLCGGSTAVLKVKYCSICNRYRQHGSYECPEDKVLAAKYKKARDKKLSVGVKMIPYRCVSSS